MTQKKTQKTEEDAARRLFAAPCEFVWGAASFDQLPDTGLPEVAFIGRSNVGKSSLINALTGRKALARTSNTPGRTQHINFFNLGDRMMLVDLPGYGFARAAKGKIKAWTRLVNTYLKGRPNLRQVVVLIDSRHGLKDSDFEMMRMLDEAAVPYVCVLTKADKARDAELAVCRDAVMAALKTHPAAFPEVFLTSAAGKTGLDALAVFLARHKSA